MRLECEHFVNAIRKKNRPRANSEVGLEVVRILAAAQEVLNTQEKQDTAIIL